jgi:hypothetical protein
MAKMSVLSALNFHTIPAEKGECAEGIGQTEHTFTVIAKGHLGLAETNGVLSSADTIELLQLSLLDILQGRLGCQ